MRYSVRLDRSPQKFLDALHADDTRAPECGIKDSVIACKGPGVALCSARPLLALPCLEDYDGLVSCKCPRRTKKSTWLAYGFHIDEDAAHARVHAEIVNEIIKSNIYHGSDGYKIGKS